MKKPLAVLIVAASLSACSGNTEPSSVSASPSVRIRTDSPQAIVDTLAAFGFPKCDRLEHRNDTLSSAISSASCWYGSDEMVVAVYASHDDAMADWKMRSEFFAAVGLGYDQTVGSNWSVSGDPDSYIKRSAELLGGKYYSTSGQ
jgi:hypothetical protein